MNHAAAETVVAWLSSLRGQVGTFRYQPRQSVTSTLTGLSLASAAYAYNTSLQVGGYTANAQTKLRLGQFFQLGDQLLRVIEAPTFADLSGRAIIGFEPELRVTFVTGALNFVAPTALLRLATSEATTFTLDPDRWPEFGTLSAREVI